jgi:hypothetical protein
MRVNRLVLSERLNSLHLSPGLLNKKAAGEGLLNKVLKRKSVTAN